MGLYLVFLWISRDYPYVITGLSLDYPRIIPGVFLDFPCLHWAISGYLFQISKHERANYYYLKLFSFTNIIYRGAHGPGNVTLRLLAEVRGEGSEGTLAVQPVIRSVVNAQKRPKNAWKLQYHLIGERGRVHEGSTKSQNLSLLKPSLTEQKWLSLVINSHHYS